MAYKLAEEDKLCGVIYPTYEGFSPIPKATCEMLESKCEQTIIVKCKDNQSEEDKKPESQSGSTSASASGSASVSESTSESNSTSESQASTSESTSESTSTGSTSTSESTTQSESTSVSTTLSTSESTSVSPSESSSTENSNTPEEPKPTPEPQPEPVPTIDLLEVLPKVDDKFSKIITKDGQVVEVPEVSNEDKRAFEDKIINDLKAKLPEGTVVEAVLEGPKYEKGSEVLSGKTNYVLNVRTTLNGVVSEQTYNVPHTEEAPKEEPEAPEVDIDSFIIRPIIGEKQVYYRRGNNYINYIHIEDKDVTEEAIKKIEDNLSNTLEGKLNKDFTGVKRYRVSTKIIQVLMPDDPYDPQLSDNDTFKVIYTITKPSGEVVEKPIMAYTRSIDWL